MQCYHNITDCIPCAVPFIPMTYSLRNWKPISPALLHPLCPTPHSPPPTPVATVSVFSALIGLILLWVFFFLIHLKYWLIFCNTQSTSYTFQKLRMGPKYPYFQILLLSSGECFKQKKNKREDEGIRYSSWHFAKIVGICHHQGGEKNRKRKYTEGCKGMSVGASKDI